MLLSALYFGVLAGVPWLFNRSSDVIYAIYARIVGIPKPEGCYCVEDTSFGAVLNWFSVVWIVGELVLLISLVLDREFMTWLRMTFEG